VEQKDERIKSFKERLEDSENRLKEERLRHNEETRQLNDAANEPEKLRQIVRALQNQQVRSLSNKQRNSLREAIQGIEKGTHPTSFRIYYNWLDVEAKQYASQLAQVLVPFGASNVPIGTREITDEVEGLVIRIKDHNAPIPVPPQAMKLWEVLSKAQISCRFDNRFRVSPHPIPLDDNYFDLAVGRKPEADGN